MNIILKEMVKFFEINIGWFFVNGRKADYWAQYINEKYFHKKD